MTSTNDGKDVKSNQTSGPKGKTYYIELYKSLEARLSGESAGGKRTQHVCEAWRRVHCLCLHSAPSTHPHLLSWLQRHTSHTILQTEWQSPKSTEQHTWLQDAINEFINECKGAISKRNGVAQLWETQLLQRACWFLSVLPNPWGHPVLKVLLDSRGPQPHDREVLEWLKEERGVMFVTRLRQLAASKCDDLALLLASAVMNRARYNTCHVADADQAEEQPQDKPEVTNELTFHNILRKEAGFTSDIWELLTDIEFVLLYKGESRARCIDLAKQTPLRNGYKLVERLHNRLEHSPQEKKLWKNAKEVATLVAQVVIARCMVVPNCSGVARAALYGCVYSLVQLLPAEKLPTAAAALAAPAATSRHLHTLAAAVHAQCKDERKPFVCSLYVRAITAGMNELEKLKLETEKASEARGIEQTLALWFIQLGTLLSASSRLSCECTLTAFSVHPSPTMYERVKRAPPLAPLVMLDVQEQDTETNTEYGSWATDSRTQTNLVKTSETLKLKQTPKQANVLSTAIFTEGEGLGLEADLCQDLAVLLSGPRVKTLYWDMDREMLLENCRMYMERTHGGTRALTTELKYLNLDPKSFQHLPEEEDEDENDIYYGIEKGYEHLVEFEEPAPEDVLCDNIMSYYSDTTETASCDSEKSITIPKRKKKKNKQPQISAEEEVDPLSLVSDTLSDKKERPHSKERSKHKNKESRKNKLKVDQDIQDHDEKIGISDIITKEIQKKAKKKEQRERKKKEKLDACNISIKDKIFQSSSNLSKPFSCQQGIKIARPNISDIGRRNTDTNIKSNTCITDSDYDSQGKSSINSEYNENALNDALTDALCSMDELKSSEETFEGTNSQRTSFPLYSYSPDTVSSVGVKKGIRRLIDYRRHKVFNDNSISQDSPENLSPNYSIDHDLLKSKKPHNIHSSVINSKGVNFLNTPHSSVNIPVKQQTILKDKSPKILKPKQPPQVRKQGVNKLSESPSQKQYQEFLLQRKYDDMQDQGHPAESIGQLQFQEFLKKQYLQPTELPVLPSRTQDLPRQLPSQMNTNVTPSQKQFHSFLKNLQVSINAGATNDVQDSKSLSTNDKTASKKIIQDKKVDNAANTYARLSYMHKNKHYESMLKSGNNPIIQNKHLVNVTTDQIRHIKNIDVEKVSNLQATGEIVLAKIDKPESKICTVEKAKVLVQNIENISSCSLNNPVLSNMLSSDKKIVDFTEPVTNDIKGIRQCINNNAPKISTSFLSEKDQLDLVSLLRQQNKLNPPKMPVKTEFLNNPSGVLINNSTSYCANYERQCLDLQNKIPILVEESKSTSCPTSVIKVANNKPLNSGSEPKKNRVKGSKQKVKIESDWKSVMNDILAHKTPSMIGPNALDIVLKKDSFEKRSSESLNSPNNRTVIISSNNPNNITNNETTKHCTQNTHIKASTSRDSSIILKPAHSADLKLNQNKVQSTNKIATGIVKKGPIQIENKHFTSVIQNSNDPFISGIPNSDYDLLEELMDDDLRQEIGELSSDEETYRTPNFSTSKMKNNHHAKECSFPINKANVVTAENPFNYSSIPGSDSVTKSYNTNYSTFKKDLCLKNNSLTKTIIQKNSGCTKDVNLKPQIISNEVITSSKFAEKSFLSGKLHKNASSNFLAAAAPNNKLCVDKVSHVKKNPLITTPKTKNQHSNKLSVSICSDSKLPKTVDNTKSLVNNVPEAPKSQNPSQVLLTVPQRNAQAQNVMLIGRTDLIYDPFTAIHITQSTDLNRNSYVAVNQAPMNVALLHSTSFVGPVLSPVIIENSVTLPVIQKVAPNISMNLTSLNCNKLETGPICKDYQQSNIIKTEPIQPKTSNAKVLEKSCLSSKDDFDELKFITTASRSSAVDSDIMSTSIPTVLSNRITEDLVQHNLLVSKEHCNLIPEVTESFNKKLSKQSQSEIIEDRHLDTKSVSQVQEDIKGLVYESTDINTLTGKTLDNKKSDVIMDQDRIKRQRMLIFNKFENLKNCSQEKPIALPYAPIESCKEDDKNQEQKLTNEKKNKRDIRIGRKISGKRDSCQKQSLPVKVNRANRSSARLTALRDVPVTFKDDAIQNSVEKKCLTRDGNEPNITKDFSSSKLDNSYTVKSKAAHHTENVEFVEPSNEINQSHKEKPICKENIVEKIKSANNSKLINMDQLVVKASENDIQMKSTEAVGVVKNENDIQMKATEAVGVVKNSCQKRDNNFSKENNSISEFLSHEYISNETGKDVPIGSGSKINNKCTQRELEVHENKDVAPKITPQNEIKISKEVEKKTISKKNAGTEKIVADSVHIKCVDVETKPVMIKSTIKNLTELCKDNIAIVGDNNMTHEQKASPLISPVMIKSTINKSDELGKHNISLVSDTITMRGLKATPLTSPVITEKLCKSKNFDLSDAKIMYEDLPNSDNGPQKKCVRITLPNGNTFKATIKQQTSNKLNVNIDSIFDDPTVKSLLWKNINNNTKCTLNIKQINKKEGSIFKTEVQDIIFPTSTETINLISDDEEDTSPQSFKTEFGTFKITSMDPGTHLKHQKKLSQKSFVLLESNVMPEAVAIDQTNIKSNEPVKLNLPTEKPVSNSQETVADYIEIDDSSNDSISVISSETNTNSNNKTSLGSDKVYELKNLLLKDLGVEDTPNITKVITKNVGGIKNSNDIQIKTLTVINDIHKTIEAVHKSTDLQKEMNNITNEIINIEDDNIEEDNMTEDKEDISGRHIDNNTKQLILKLKKCDDLVEKLRIKKQKCFVSLIRCDDASKDVEKKKDIFTYYKGIEESLDDVLCLQNEITETILKRSDSESILNDLDNTATTVDPSSSTYCNEESSAPMSPSLIDNLEIPVSLTENSIVNSDVLIGLSKCDADWCMTKPFLNKYNSFDISDRVLLERYEEYENNDDSLTDCDSDHDSSLSTGESFQVPSLVKLVVNLFTNNSNILERLTNKDLTSKYVKNMNSSPLKRKANDRAERRRQNKLCKIVNNVDNEYGCRSMQNCHNTEINNTIMHISENVAMSYYSLSNEKPSDIDSEMKESRNQPLGINDDLQNNMQFRQVASLLRLAIKSFQVNYEIEDIASKHKLINLPPSTLNENFCFRKAFENSSRIEMDLIENNVRYECNLGSYKPVPEGIRSLKRLKPCPLSVSEDSRHIGINEKTGYSIKNIDISTNKKNNDFVHITKLDDDIIHATCVIDDKYNIEPCSIITDIQSLSQSKNEWETDSSTVNVFEDDLMMVSEVKENDHYKDSESSLQSKDEHDFLHNTTQGHEVGTDIAKVSKYEQKNHDEVNETEECNAQGSDITVCSILAQITKSTETEPALQSESYDVNATSSLEIEIQTPEDAAMITKENTEIYLGGPSFTINITGNSDELQTKPEIKLDHASKLTEKEKACANNENAKAYSLLTLSENSNLDLLSLNDLTPDLETHDALKQTEHGVVFNCNTKTDKVNDSDGKNSSEMITTDDATQKQQQIKLDVVKNDKVSLKYKINSGTQENKNLDWTVTDKPTANPLAKLSYSNFSNARDLFEDKSLIDIKVKQIEINAVDQLDVNLKSSTNFAQDTKLMDRLKYNPYSYDDNVNVSLEDLESTPTLKTSAVLHQKLDVKIEDNILLSSFKVAEELLAKNNVVDAKILDTDICSGKESEKWPLDTSEHIHIDDCKLKESDPCDDCDNNKFHEPIVLPENKLHIDAEIIKQEENFDLVIDAYNIRNSEKVSLETITKLPENKLDIGAKNVNSIINKDTNFDIVIDTCNDIQSETVSPETVYKLKEIEDNAVSDATTKEKIVSSTSDKNNFETVSILTEPFPLLQPILNSQERLQADDQSKRAVICLTEESQDRVLDIIEMKKNNLYVEVDKKSLDPSMKYELQVEVHVENTSTSCDLNSPVTMEKAEINSSINPNLSLCDYNEDIFKSCFSKESECVSVEKATKKHSKLKENFNCSVVLNVLQITTNAKVNGKDIGVQKNGTDRDDIAYQSNEFTPPDLNNINEITETEKEPAHTNNLVSVKEKIIGNDIRHSDCVFQTDQDINENAECIYVNDEVNLKKECSESKTESNSPNDDKLQKSVMLVYKGDSNVILKGSIYEDPVVGTCYVFPIVNRTPLTDETNCSNVCDDKTINVLESLKTKIYEECSEHDVLDDLQTVENFNVLLPKLTYSRQRFKNNDIINIGDKTNRKNLKRKLSCYDNKFHAKRYRKGKNIDYPKFSVATVLESGYSKEYKRLLDYWTSVKFSYSRPFHKEDIDIRGLLNDWPIKETNMNVSDNTDFENILFSEDQFEKQDPFDPLQQTLAQEISQCNEQQYISYDINETNFNMGFGEGSDRVIQISEDENIISKVSAATLSDVKQSQPFLTTKHYEYCGKNQMLCMSHKHQKEILKRSISYIQLRDKIRSFFKKTTAELNYHWLMDTMKSKYKNSYNNNSLFLKSGFPSDLLNSDFIDPAPVEAIVQVVQVGQLPVSAAAQNPVTCDPRVTQVTDASPQCSIENSPHDDSHSPIKTEYTELTTADLSLPLVQEYDRQMESHESSKMTNSHHEDIPVETEMTSIVKTEITIELSPLKEEPIDYNDSDDLQSLVNKHINNVDYSFDSNDNSILEPQSNTDVSYESLDNHETDFSPQEKQQNGSTEKTDQIAHAMNAAGITTTPETMMNTRAHALVNMLSQKNCQEGPAASTTSSANNYSKAPVNAMTLQQALAQILPPPLNQTTVHENNQTNTSSSVTSQVLHIVQGKNTNGNQITLVDNSQNSVISNSNTPVLHIVQNKGANTNSTPNANSGQHTNSYSGLSLVDTGIQQGSNQLLHIVNTGNQKNNQLLKRVNLLTNLTNVQGSNEQKMVQFVCKSADGKSIHLNAPHQRSMVLRLQPIESPNIQSNPKTAECQDNASSSPTSNTSSNTTTNKESTNAQHEIKSRSVYEENYAKFIQNSSNKSVEKSTSLPKFGQAFGKQVFQDGNQKGNDINANNSNLPSINSNSESSECQPNDNSVNLDHIGQLNSPPLLLRKSPSQPVHSQPSQSNLVQQLKQTIAPMNIQTMHGGVIYTRQIPVNIGGGQTINLITVPSTELIDEANQKQKGDVKFVNQNELDSPIIKIVPQNQNTPNAESTHDDTNSHTGMPNDSAQNPPAQHQPVLTQMRIKLPMLSKTPQMVSGARVVRPSFFQIQRNVIGGANQHVYQQLVLTAAPPLGQHTIRLPQAQANRQVTKTTADGQSTSEPQMSSSTLEQLREFDMVLEQVKERSTVQPNSNTNNTFTKLLTPTTETNEGTSVTSTVTESTQQVLYSIGSNQSLNVAYINRKTVATTPTTSTFVRSPDSSGIIDSPSSSSHIQIPHTVTSESTLNEASAQPSQPKPAKVGSKSKSRPKSSSNPPSSLKINTLPPKPTQKPLEDEQTTQRILYILAEYKEQVENSPDKDKPAPRRRSNPPTNPSGSSKRKKSSNGSRRPGARDMSPVHGEDTCRTMGSEDSSCGTSQGDCNESCLDSHSPQDSPRKVVRKLTFENETSPVAQPRPQPQRNVIVADGQTITVARGTAGKPATAVLMPANYILPVSMVKGGQQIAIVTNRGPKLLTVGGGEGGATNALLLQRLIGPAGLKPVLTRPGVRHVRLPTAALHNLQAFNLTTATAVQPPDSTASPAPAPTPPELIETRANSSPWTDRESQDVKPERDSSPEGSEPWNLPSSADPHDYTYEETVRTDNMDRTVLVVHKKDGTSQRHHRLTHVSAAALRHKYAILEHELRLQGSAYFQKSLSEECEDLGVDSPSASELFPEAELLFAASPAHDAPQHSHTPQPTILNQSGIPQPDIDDQIATDELLQPDVHEDQQELDVTTLGLDEGIVTVSEDGMQATIQLDQEEFARSHPNTTFHSEPTDEGEVQPFTISGLKGRHITSTIFHAGRAPATVLVTAPQATVISQANPDHAIPNNVKYSHMDQIINSSPVTHGNLNLSSVLVKDDGLTKFDNILTDSRELHLSNTASAIVHSTGNATQVIRRVCYEDDKRDTRFLIDEPDAIIAGDDAKMIAEDSSRDATLESIAGDVDDDNSSPERHAELFWESNSASERSESRRPMDFSSDSEKCCKSPSFDETNSTDSSGVGTHMRLDSVIKNARGIERSGSADGSSADDTHHPPLRTYPAKRMYHALDGEVERSMSGKTRAGERSPDNLEVRRRASGRGVVKRGCHCCTGSPAPPRPKKPRQRKPAMDFTN
ncbi:extracellular matrix-binding protein ebh-like isoform X3 [Maniola hyperantus]|uniref:extracellular matrix-binding protein ebh-like isoform X3 n=1 Tax=Aphantopus hyperantus TaxID=2795564 RepID=UPI00212572EF